MERIKVDGSRACALLCGLAIAGMTSAMSLVAVAQPPSGPRQPRAEAGKVNVHISADAEGVELVQVGPLADFRARGFRSLHSVCRAPCDVVIDGTKDEFVIVGRSTPMSAPFALSQNIGDTTLEVDSGSFGALVTVITGATIGGFAGIAGFTLIGAGREVGGDIGSDLGNAGAVALGISALGLLTAAIASPFTETDVDVVGKRCTKKTPR